MLLIRAKLGVRVSPGLPLFKGNLMFAGLKELWCDPDPRLEEDTPCFMGVARGNDLTAVAQELASRTGWFNRGVSKDFSRYKGCALFLGQ